MASSARPLFLHSAAAGVPRASDYRSGGGTASSAGAAVTAARLASHPGSWAARGLSRSDLEFGQAPDRASTMSQPASTFYADYGRQFPGYGLAPPARSAASALEGGYGGAAAMPRPASAGPSSSRASAAASPTASHGSGSTAGSPRARSALAGAPERTLLSHGLHGALGSYAAARSAPHHSAVGGTPASTCRVIVGPYGDDSDETTPITPSSGAAPPTRPPPPEPASAMVEGSGAALAAEIAALTGSRPSSMSPQALDAHAAQTRVRELEAANDEARAAITRLTARLQQLEVAQRRESADAAARITTLEAECTAARTEVDTLGRRVRQLEGAARDHDAERSQWADAGAAMRQMLAQMTTAVGRLPAVPVVAAAAPPQQPPSRPAAAAAPAAAYGPSQAAAAAPEAPQPPPPVGEWQCPRCPTVMNAGDRVVCVYCGDTFRCSSCGRIDRPAKMEQDREAGGVNHARCRGCSQWTVILDSQFPA